MVTFYLLFVMEVVTERSLRNALREYLAHFHAERNHQRLDNRLIEPSDKVNEPTGQIQCRQRLGGLLQYFYRQAA